METVRLIHQRLRNELSGYIKSQYIGKNNLMLSALEDDLDKREVLWQTPFVELPASYKLFEGGLNNLDLPEWMIKFFLQLAEKGLGVYNTPFDHQGTSLERAYKGEDLFISTGTGSGKTECFMWPLIAKLCLEAKTKPHAWEMRGIRAIAMYPMNALVADQVSRLRRMIGNDAFLDIFRATSFEDARRPQFGMYTGRTPYPGNDSKEKSDRELAHSLSRLLHGNAMTDDIFDALQKEGRIPAKIDLGMYIEKLKKGQHLTAYNDAELITRFEMQKNCPDILITNYSMLEYMLLRPREAAIWQSTKAWLSQNPDDKLLFIIDEAHMYRGASGGEVALLIRRLMHKLDISRERIQFILTTASMPHENREDKEAVSRFAMNLTSADRDEFCYLFGELEEFGTHASTVLNNERFLAWKYKNTDSDDMLLETLNRFWDGVTPAFDSLVKAQIWMYKNIRSYNQFQQLFNFCSGTARSISEIAQELFHEFCEEKALMASYNLLDIAACAISEKGESLFPIRLHMIFRGIQGLYACTNPKCGKKHTYDSVTLGQIYMDDSLFTCPECGGVVHELINDRRCGSLFLKGYVSVSERDIPKGKTFLWRDPGLFFSKKLREIHLFIPQENKKYDSRGEYRLKPCYLDSKSGFIYFDDDTVLGRDNIMKLYFNTYSEKRRPDAFTFASCPHCHHQLSKMQLTSFTTRGNLSFYNLIKAQFNAQPSAPHKEDKSKYPNQGRKVLLFSDSRQRAARLALDMSQASDEMAIMQLFMLALDEMKSNKNLTLDELYGYFIKEAAMRNIRLFYGESQEKYREFCLRAIRGMKQAETHGKKFVSRRTFENAPAMMEEHLIRMFCSGYNTVFDNALAWLEPVEYALEDSLDALEDMGVIVSQEEFVEVFNAWIMDICNKYGALGHRISDDRRKAVLTSYQRLGMTKAWKFSAKMMQVMEWKKDKKTMEAWKSVLHEQFLDGTDDSYYIQLSRVVVRDGLEHKWFKCKACAELTAFPLAKKCPTCSSDEIRELTAQEYEALAFWRNPIVQARNGEPIHVIDTQEHTAQLSHNDKRDDLWSKTEKYEMRFQDLLQSDEVPVDILSCTTTMEVGIDIGSLTAVGLRNVPPMRENYQQRAGRAGRRGSGLSTIVTYCENGAHDSRYFRNPEPMFRGNPRKPWLDVESEKLLGRHMSLIILQSFLDAYDDSLDDIQTVSFFEEKLEPVIRFVNDYDGYHHNSLLRGCTDNFVVRHKNDLVKSLQLLNGKRLAHPELYEGNVGEKGKSLLDALYEEGMIPTYSFPKDVVSFYVNDEYGNVKYRADRGLDVAIGEYAPGRSLVIDKNSYQIGGLYYSGSEKRRDTGFSPAQKFMEDPNYVKQINTCDHCSWFGFEDDLQDGKCPMCSRAVKADKSMVRPWGFGPINGVPFSQAKIRETYSYPDAPEYSVLPAADDLECISGFVHAKMAVRNNQRIIMRNKGENSRGFMICPVCGAAAAGDEMDAFEQERGIRIDRPYKTTNAKFPCKHANARNYMLGFDFVTDMFVLELEIDPYRVNTRHDGENPWLDRAARSLAEAMRLQASTLLDIEFTELNAGYRLRYTSDWVYVDVYLYDNLSSGAGYSSELKNRIDLLLEMLEIFLDDCACENACQNCLKHYRNPAYHATLDRHAALNLLRWAKEEWINPSISMEKQRQMIMPLANVLSDYGIEVVCQNDELHLVTAKNTRILCIYPTMWDRPKQAKVTFVSEFEVKYARAYAVEMIRNTMLQSNA